MSDELDNYLTSDRGSFNIYIEGAFYASCASVEYKLKLLDMVVDMLNDTRDHLIQERDEDEKIENNISNISPNEKVSTPVSILQSKIEQVKFSSSDAKKELLEMSTLYKSSGTEYNFGKYGLYHHEESIVNFHFVHKISSSEDLFEYESSEEEKIYAIVSNLKKHLFETIKFRHITIDDFLKFMKVVIDLN